MNLDFNLQTVEQERDDEDRGIDVALDKPYDICPVKGCSCENKLDYNDCAKFQNWQEIRKWKL